MNKKLKNSLSLFGVFFKIGLFTFGGGYAMIPLIQRETVAKKKWVTDEDVLEMVAIAESTPGSIAVNISTFVGYRIAGFLGAFFATVGVVLPSFAIILAVSFAIQKFSDILAVQYAFRGVRACVLALMINSLFNMYRQSPKNLISYIIMMFAFVLTAFLNVNVLLVIVCCAAVGLISSWVAQRKISEDGTKS